MLPRTRGAGWPGRRRAGGRALVDLFLERQRARLPAEARARLERVQRSHIGLYEVEAVEPDVGLTLVDAWTGERLAVRERLATRQLVRFDILAARCTREPEGHWIIEGDVYPFSPALKGEVLRILKQRYRTFRRREPGGDVAVFLKGEGVLFNDLWLDWMVLVPPPRIVTVEGDDVAPSRVVFDVRDRQVLLAALDRHADLDREADLPVPVWIWTEPGEEPRRTLGSIRFKGRRLVLETMSRPRAERGRGMIEGAAGDAVRHRVTEIEDLGRAMKAASKRPPRDPGPPPEEAREILQAFYEQHYRSWVDEPLPILGGRTPRAAARLKTGRQKVIDLLKSLERDQAHAARQGEPAYDVGWIWEELGLPRP